MYQQVKLKREKSYTVGWTDMKVKLHQKVTIDKQEGIWEVVQIYNGLKLTEVPKQDWKVGGLV